MIRYKKLSKGYSIALMCTAIMMLLFSIGAFLLNFGAMSINANRTQMVCDIAADAGAKEKLGISSNTSIYSPNSQSIETKIKNRANKVFNLNNVPGSISTELSDYKNDDNEKIGTAVTINVESTRNLIIRNYFRNRNNLFLNNYTVRRSATTVAFDYYGSVGGLYSDGGGQLTMRRMLDDGLYNLTSWSPEYTTYFVQYYLSPQTNPIYQPTDRVTFCNFFMHDYLICMGFDETNYQSRQAQQWWKDFSDGRFGSDWKLYKSPTVENATAIQKAANEGKPCIYIMSTSTNPNSSVAGGHCAVVVPSQKNLPSGYIATAQAGSSLWNYRETPISYWFGSWAPHAIFCVYEGDMP